MGYDPSGAWDWGGVAVGVGIIALTALTVSTFGIGSIVGAICAGAAYTTGAVTTYAAATDSAMVIDISYSYQASPHGYIKSGASVVIDFGTDDANLYLHTGSGYGVSSGVSYSVGMVANYDEPSDYAGPFVNYTAGNSMGIDRCWSPTDGIVSGAGANSMTFSLGFGYGVGYDHYSDPIALHAW